MRCTNEGVLRRVGSAGSIKLDRIEQIASKIFYLPRDFVCILGEQNSSIGLECWWVKFIKKRSKYPQTWKVQLGAWCKSEVIKKIS